MPLFQSSVLQKYINALDTAVVDAAYERFTAHFHDAGIQENIRNAKEEQYQGEFLIDLFVNVLGYVKNPTPAFNLTTELKNVKDSKKADGAILTPALSKGEGESQVIAVIELKGTAVTDLGKIEVQAFGYKNNQPGCVFVITSNFEKLRFYIDNAVDFEEFNLFALSRERFDVLWLCLSAATLLQLQPKQLKDESLTREEVVTKVLYKDYSLFRTEVYQNIVANNPQVDKLTLFKVTQKLLDRFLFIFFAEDRLLLPPNSILAIVQQWKDLRDKYDEYQPLYDRFKKYFGYMNTGHKGQKHDIFAYNGGLFKADPILDSITIDDDLLHKHTVKLSNYDFVSEVSVNILGHIFEHSLNEIEEIQAEIEGTAPEKATSKRKKDGVFYTPKYITKYIVDNTVGTLCEAKKTEMGIDDAEYDRGRKGRQKATIKALTKNLDDYRAWLLQLTICDPACGSGAFLNQALEFLIAEHAYLDELYAKLHGDAMRLYEVENSILENNLFGVDINNESVEIAKLSLWLRTAQKGRKLTSLNNNIKCGNSLIDDPAVAGDKAFDWVKEFPQVFKNGGFDVVIGNPPYVQIRNLPGMSDILSQCNFKTFEKMGDLYCLFYEQGVNILSKNGLLGYITSNTWMRANYGASLRNFLSNETNPLKLIDLGSGVFDSATVDSNILILQKKSVDKYNLKAINLSNESTLDSFDELKNNYIIINDLSQEPWVISDPFERRIRNKVEKVGVPLENWEIDIFRGVQTGNNDVFIIDRQTRDRLIFENSNAKNIIFPILQGKNLSRYNADFNEQYLIYTTSDTKLEDFPSIQKYLLENKHKLDTKIEVKQGKMVWYSLYRPARNHFNEFFKDKMIFSKASKEQSFFLDNNIKAVALNTSYIATGKYIKSLLSILNSKLIRYCFINFYQSGGINGEITIQAIERIPIPFLDNLKKTTFENCAVEISLKSQVLKNIENQFIQLLQSKFPIEKLTNKLQSWHTLPFGEFLKELKKAKVSLSLSEEAEWMAYFNAQKAKAQNLQQEIDRVDKEIDTMVYALYGLTEEEVAIVEGS